LSNAEIEIQQTTDKFIKKEKLFTKIRYGVITILLLSIIYSMVTRGNLLFEIILFISAYAVFYTETRSLSKVCVYMINQYTELEKITEDPASKTKYHKEAGFFLEQLLRLKR